MPCLFFRGFSLSHRREVPRSFWTKNVEPQTCSCWPYVVFFVWPMLHPLRATDFALEQMRHGHIGLAKCETAITETGLVPSGFDQNKGRQAVHSLHKKSRLRSARPRRRKKLQVLPNAQLLLRHDPQGALEESHPHQGQGRNVRQGSRCSGTLTVETNACDCVVEKRQRVSLLRGLSQKDTLL